jgi:hypothetical protein
VPGASIQRSLLYEDADKEEGEEDEEGGEVEDGDVAKDN